MKRRMILAMLLVASMLFSACSGNSDVDDIPMISQQFGASPSAAPTPTVEPETESQSGISGNIGGQSIFDVNPYDIDPLGEEGVDPYVEPETVATPTPTTYPYAGTTPIPLDPIDMPTPTPRPQLTFSYVEYTSANVGVHFEGPVGWTVNESQAGTLYLSEPEAQIKEGQQCIVTIFSQNLGTNYTQSEMEDEVIGRLEGMSATGFSEFKRSYTATRYMMGKVAVYANYTGTLTDGTEIGGRIQYVCLDGVLYGVEIVFPLGYRDDYLNNVFAKIRSTIARN